MYKHLLHPRAGTAWRGYPSPSRAYVNWALCVCALLSPVKCADYTPYYYEICSIIMATLAVRRVWVLRLGQPLNSHLAWPYVTGSPPWLSSQSVSLSVCASLSHPSPVPYIDNAASSGLATTLRDASLSCRWRRRWRCQSTVYPLSLSLSLYLSPSLALWLLFSSCQFIYGAVQVFTHSSALRLIGHETQSKWRRQRSGRETERVRGTRRGREVWSRTRQQKCRKKSHRSKRSTRIANRSLELYNWSWWGFDLWPVGRSHCVQAQQSIVL